MRIALIALFGLVLTGCDVFRCDEGAMKCSADGLATCNAYGEWEVGGCCAQDGCREVVDADGKDIAVCTPIDEPDPRCDGVGFGNVCVDGPASLYCNDGFGGHEHACDAVCVTLEPGTAFCALADQPDPRCADGRRDEHCSGDRIVSCFEGFAVGETLCEAPFGECTEVPDNLGGRNPRCAGPLDPLECPTDTPGRCDGNDIFSCHGTRKTFEHCAFSCYENPIDSMFPEAFCDSQPCDIGF